MSHTIVITGATGFVGSHVLEQFCKINHNDIHLVAACRDRSRLIPEFTGEVREGDLLDDAYLDRVLTGADVVIHCAAWTSLYGQGKNSAKLFLEPSIKLIDKAIEWRAKKFIFISTTSAAAPAHSAEALSPGIRRRYWPHLNNVISIEDYMRENSQRTTSMINLRLGLFAGNRYALGLLPILLPRLKTHLVPWVGGGNTGLPVVDGRDIAQAVVRAALAPNLPAYESINIVGPEVPSARQVIDYIAEKYHYPRPHFSVPFSLAFGFAWLVECLNPLTPGDPLITRSIVHLLRETGANNRKAEELLGYTPEIHWKQAISTQVDQMLAHGDEKMKMHRPLKKRGTV